jgi:hypothetical protein
VAGGVPGADVGAAVSGHDGRRLFFAGQHITDQDAAGDVELAGVLARVGAGFLKVVAAGLPAPGWRYRVTELTRQKWFALMHSSDYMCYYCE